MSGIVGRDAPARAGPDWRDFVDVLGTIGAKEVTFGTGDTLTANRLRRLCSADEAEITVVDQDDRHVYQPESPIRPRLAGLG